MKRTARAKTPRPAGLPDRARPGIRALFVGINPGIRSAAIGHHFAGFSNHFWKLLHESALVPEPLGPEDDERLPEFGYGITNLVSRPTPGISDLKAAEYDAGRRALAAKIRRYRPEVVVLVGVTLYRALFGSAPAARSQVPAGSVSPVGLREERLGGVPVFVLPNPSGRNANFTHREMLSAFEQLKAFLSAT